MGDTGPRDWDGLDGGGSGAGLERRVVCGGLDWIGLDWV